MYCTKIESYLPILSFFLNCMYKSLKMLVYFLSHSFAKEITSEKFQ